LDRADWSAQELLSDDQRIAGAFMTSSGAALVDRVNAFRKRLDAFQEMTTRRWTNSRYTPQGSDTDQDYDQAFRELVALARSMKDDAGQIIRVEQRLLDGLQLLLLGFALVLAAYIAFRLGGYVIRRREVEQALRESEEKFRGLYESSNDAIMLLDEKSFFDCNEATLRVFRVDSREDFCRKHPADLSPPRQPDGSDSMQLANRKIATALKEGVNQFEWMHVRADGTPFPAEVLLSAVHIEERRVLQAVVRDVTVRKHAEEQLRANEEKLRTISEAALDAVIMMDEWGRAVHWNPAAQKMFGYTAEEVIGQEIHRQLAPRRMHDTIIEALDLFFATGQGRAVGRILELEAVRKGGEEFPIEISVSPIRVGNAWNAVAVVRDITERRQAEQSLRAEQRALRRLLKSHDQERKLIAYEIHDGLAQQLVAAIMQCQAGERTARGAETNGTHVFASLLAMLRQCLMETRRLISGVRPPILDEFGVVTAVKGLIEETEEQGGPRIVFHNNIEFQRLEPVLENTIYRIVQEGLRNACRHSQSDRVLIELTHEEHRVRVRVQDWGVGFVPDEVDRKRYGLAGIYERARLLGGRVNLQSKVGEGTTIAVELPEDVGDLADTD
jgi:PAS domain S-box-containing protein